MHLQTTEISTGKLVTTPVIPRRPAFFLLMQTEHLLASQVDIKRV